MVEVKVIKTTEEKRLELMLDLLNMPVHKFGKKYGEIEINDGKILRVGIKNNKNEKGKLL